jgi:hypothetical protein
VTGPIDAFLAELGRLLRGGAEERSRVAAEVGDHLRDLAAEARARGLGDLDAESEAVERFGSPRELARGLQPSGRRSGRAQVALSLTLAGACAGLAFAVLRSPAPRVSNARGGIAVAQPVPALETQAREAIGCVVAIPAPAGGRQTQVVLASEVELDPRTGRIVGCVPVYRRGATMLPLSSALQHLSYGFDGRYVSG